MLLLSGCTSVLAIGTAYDSAANRLEGELLDYADFNVAQSEAIKQRVSAFHQWHRQNQLPRYSNFMRQVAAQLTSDQSISNAQVANWVTTARGFITELNQCNPLNQSGNLLVTLSNSQLRQIRKTLAEKREQRLEEYLSESHTQRIKRRKDTTVKWSRRAGVTMTEAQKDLLSATLQNQTSLTPKRQELWQQWSDQLLAIAENKNLKQHEALIDQHISTLWNLTERNYPDEWQQSIERWQDFLSQFIQTMTAEQIDRFSAKLLNIADTLDKLQTRKRGRPARCFNAVG